MVKVAPGALHSHLSLLNYRQLALGSGCIGRGVLFGLGKGAGPFACSHCAVIDMFFGHDLLAKQGFPAVELALRQIKLHLILGRRTLLRPQHGLIFSEQGIRLG